MAALGIEYKGPWIHGISVRLDCKLQLRSGDIYGAGAQCIGYVRDNVGFGNV